jgi:DNA-binding NarL/FixJ family response regulator
MIRSGTGEDICIREPRFAPDRSDPAETMVLIGHWSAVPAAASLTRVEETLVVRCEPRLRACQLAMSTYDPDWLVLGEGPTDDDRDAFVQAARLMRAGLKVAVLGPEGDLAMAERWLRRGCSAYLAVWTPMDRVLHILRSSRELSVCVVDQCFQDTWHMRKVPPVTDLTRREREVLHLMRLGRRNREIARQLVVSESTVDFHIRNVLEKMGARNRVEAIKRADMLGI